MSFSLQKSRSTSALEIGLLATMLICVQPATAAEIEFTDVTASAGLIEPLAGLMGHGAAWGDFDADGKIEHPIVGGFCDRPNVEYAPAAGPVPTRLLRNLGNGRFEVVQRSPVETFARASGAVFADLDNNGTLELYVANNAKQRAGRAEEPQRSAQTRHAQLFRNDAGTFVDISTESESCPESLYTARNIGVLDYDCDGLLDLLIVEDKFTSTPRSALLRNLGGLKFVDVTREAGLPENLFGLGLGVADLNGDGHPDFLFGHSNRIFLSQPGNQYRESAALATVFKYEPLDGEDWPCGVAFGDLNRDGRLDVVISAHAKSARNRLFLNDGLKDGVPRFREITREAGVGEIVPAKCPHVEIQDFDNDGWPDIYFSAAWMDADGSIAPLLFRHSGSTSGGIPKFAPLREIKEPMVYFPAGPSGDYDNDGRLDLLLVNWFAGNHSRLLRNTSAVQNHWLHLAVRGRRMNRMGIGTQLSLFRAGAIGDPVGLLGFQEIATGYGYASGQPAICHFGLGDQQEVDVLVRFPDGTVVKRLGVKANQTMTIEEP